MADDNVFPRATEKCGIEPLEPIEIEPLITDPTVPCPPDEIPACEQPPEDFLPEQPPCPSVSVDHGTVKTGFVKIDPYLSAPRAIFSVTRSDCCGFDFDIDIGLPPDLFDSFSGADPACPEFVPSQSIDHGAPGEAGNLTLDFIRRPASCSFDVPIDVLFPVPAHEPTVHYSIDPTGDGDVTFTINYPTLLNFTHDLTVKFPSRQSYCPVLTVNTVNYGYTGSVPFVNFAITHTSNCHFLFDLAVGFPCPTINDPVTGFYVSDDSTAAVEFLVARTEDSCAFDFDLFIKFPCPVLKVGDVTWDEDSIPYVDLTINQVPGSCAFAVDLDVVFPTAGSCPTLNPPLVDIAYDSDSIAAVEFNINKVPDQCEFDFDFFIRFPCPVLHDPVTGFDYSGSSSAAVEFLIAHAEDECAFDFDLFIQFPCPVLNEPMVDVVYDGDSLAAVEFNVRKVDGECAFDFDFFIRFPCPVLNEPMVDVVYDGDSLAAVEFNVRRAEDECAFDFDFFIRFPCPVLNEPMVDVVYNGDSVAAVEFNVRKVDGECAFDFDFFIRFPCPVLKSGSEVQLDGCNVRAVTHRSDEDCVWEIGLEKYNCAPPLTVNVMDDKDCSGGSERFHFTRLTIPGATAQDLGWFVRQPCAPSNGGGGTLPPGCCCQVSYVGISTATGDSTGIIHLPLPTGTRAGDLMLAVISSYDVGGGPAPEAPNGWNGVSGGSIFAVWWRRACGGEPASYTFQSGGLYSVGSISTYRNAGTPVAGTHGSGNSTTITASGINLSSRNQFIVGVFSKSGSGPIFYTPPNNMAAIQNQTGESSNVRQLVATEVVCREGNTGARQTSTFTPATPWEAILIQIPEDCCPQTCDSFTDSVTSISEPPGPSGSIQPPVDVVNVTVPCCANPIPNVLYGTFTYCSGGFMPLLGRTFALVGDFDTGHGGTHNCTTAGNYCWVATEPVCNDITGNTLTVICGSLGMFYLKLVTYTSPQTGGSCIPLHIIFQLFSNPGSACGDGTNGSATFEVTETPP